MLLIPLFALVAGFVLFYVTLHGYSLSENIAPYTAIALLAGLDTVLGGWRAWLDDKFDDTVFVTGFFVNAMLAAGLVALGERFGLEANLSGGQISIMMIGAVVVFSMRIFNNLGVLRRLLIERWRNRAARRRAGAQTAIADAEFAAAKPEDSSALPAVH